jgi:hypothetical protein
METLHPIEFCPAAACAAAIVRLERAVDLLDRMKSEAELARSRALFEKFEAIMDEMMLTSDEARTRLAEVEAVSAAGAMAQLLAAIRDIRVGDDRETVRARDLEAKAVRFLVAAGLLSAAACGQISQSRLGRRLSSPAPEQHAM